jgi:acyl-CoA oxidase
MRMHAPTPVAPRSHYQSREEEYVGGLRAALGIWQKMQDEGLGLEDGLMMRQLVDWPGGLELHIGVGLGWG